MKKSFTLIEILISTLILSFVFIAISNILSSLKLTNKTLLGKVENKEEYLVKALYYDILNAKSIKVLHSQNPKIDLIKLTTTNSLYGYSKPFVMWIVARGNLIRVESIEKNPAKYVTLDNFAKNIKIFKVYKKDGKYLVFINKKFFEFFKGK